MTKLKKIQRAIRSSNRIGTIPPDFDCSSDTLNYLVWSVTKNYSKDFCLHKNPNTLYNGKNPCLGNYCKKKY